jgi:NAD(P)-dependent dehydrogenase (short-subunit alcohol dehydrogenase family)
MTELSGRTTIVVGASRGLGRGIATAFAKACAPVVAVARTAGTFAEPGDGALAQVTSTGAGGAGLGDPRNRGSRGGWSRNRTYFPEMCPTPCMRPSMPGRYALVGRRRRGPPGAG